jgi:hypothetical protein
MAYYVASKFIPEPCGSLCKLHIDPWRLTLEPWMLLTDSWIHGDSLWKCGCCPRIHEVCQWSHGGSLWGHWRLAMEPWRLTLAPRRLFMVPLRLQGKTPGLHLEPPQWPKNETLWYQCMSHVHIQGKVLYWFTHRKSALPYLI